MKGQFQKVGLVPTWLPFTVQIVTVQIVTVQIVINGREWLSRKLIKRHIDFERRDNCFVDIADFDQAPRLMQQQL